MCERCCVLLEGIFQVMFSIIAMEFLKLQPEENGYLMAYLGILQMVGGQRKNTHIFMPLRHGDVGLRDEVCKISSVCSGYSGRSDWPADGEVL